MMRLNKINIRSFEKGLVFIKNEFTEVLDSGEHWVIDPLGRKRVEVVSQRDPWIKHMDLDVMVKSGKLDEHATVLDLSDNQRALVWIDGRFERIMSPGLYAYWNGFRQVRVEVIEVTTSRFEHKDLSRIMSTPIAKLTLDEFLVEEGRVGTVLQDGKLLDVLSPGKYAFWKDVAKVKFLVADMREKSMDVNGQDIMTADNVTLRMNAVISYRISDAWIQAASATRWS